MKDWRVTKNENFWQIYYITKSGKKRYYNASLSYPDTMALLDCVRDKDIRDAVLAVWSAPLLGPNPWDGKWDIFHRIEKISQKHGCKSRIPEYKIREVIMTEDEE